MHGCRQQRSSTATRRGCLGCMQKALQPIEPPKNFHHTLGLCYMAWPRNNLIITQEGVIVIRIPMKTLDPVQGIASTIGGLAMRHHYYGAPQQGVKTDTRGQRVAPDAAAGLSGAPEQQRCKINNAQALNGASGGEMHAESAQGDSSGCGGSVVTFHLERDPQVELATNKGQE